MRTHTHFTDTDTEYHPIRPVQIVARVVDFVFNLLYALLLIRFVLEFLNAASNTGFFEFIRRTTAPFFGPFQGIVGTTSFAGHPIVWSLVIAIAAYMVVHAVIRAVLRIVANA
jgi:uncharacterized protein YggT (Ycf19 family)